MIEKTDVIVIGAGPVGLFAIFELGLLNISCHVIDNLDKPGGQCAELYPEKPIYDIPSRVKITGQQLTDDLLAQAKPFNPVYHLNQQVEKITKLETNEWIVQTSTNKKLQAKCIVIAAGAGSFVPRKIPIANLDNLDGKKIDTVIRICSRYRFIFYLWIKAMNKINVAPVINTLIYRTFRLSNIDLVPTDLRNF